MTMMMMLIIIIMIIIIIIKRTAAVSENVNSTVPLITRKSYMKCNIKVRNVSTIKLPINAPSVY